MPVLSTDNIGLSFGAFDLFGGISLTVANDAKIGLIGPNGIGKTSLMLILAGINAPTTGKVHIARGKRLGYLHQEAVEAFASRENSVFVEMRRVFAHLQEEQERLHAMESRMAAGDHSGQLMQRYGAMQEAFDKAGGYDYEIRIQQTLDGLGLGKSLWHMPLNHLSGGQKTRALLARLLLEKPDLLMLDEPTNHLDIEAVEWLEHTLQTWEGAVLIVSHDRFFLDNTVNTTWEMSRSGIETYSGNYSAYLVQRQERWAYYERVFEEEKERLLKEVDFVQRNWVRASTHARALGVLRRLSRDLALVDAKGIMALRSGKKWSQEDVHVERPLDVIEAIRKVNAISLGSNRPRAIRPRLRVDHTSGTIVLRARSLSVGYPGNELFTAAEIDLKRGECVALIGPNGSGKTTFLKVLLEQLEPLKGEVTHGASLKIGYFAQEAPSNPPHFETQKWGRQVGAGEQTVLEELLGHKSMDELPARSMLAQYLFTGDDVFKPLRALSGGERARLALAILALEGANFLLLDEPSNHLDIPAREALQEVLEAYPGTILLVSHDRYQIDRLATQIWEIRGKTLEIFKGTYREYVLQKAATRGPQTHQLLLKPKPLVHDNSKQTKRRMEELERTETRIREHEHTIQRLAQEMQKAGGAKSYERVNHLSREMARAQADLEELMKDWEKLAE